MLIWFDLFWFCLNFDFDVGVGFDLLCIVLSLIWIIVDLSWCWLGVASDFEFDVSWCWFVDLMWVALVWFDVDVYSICSGLICLVWFNFWFYLMWSCSRLGLTWCWFWCWVCIVLIWYWFDSVNFLLGPVLVVIWFCVGVDLIWFDLIWRDIVVALGLMWFDLPCLDLIWFGFG